jgi:crotonobetainyl-CoA:carnitine CoA-transferase CaiB-like acyl-CoA transferase
MSNMTDTSDTALPLAGLKILDLSRVLAGPYCCALMGEQGADVIKVERPVTGDENRRWGDLWHGESIDFMNVNRNKRGITVDLKSAEGQAIIRKLAGWADVLVESFPPGTIEKFDLDYPKLKPLNERLIYCSLSAFGDKGDLRSKPGYDGTLQAFSGHMMITGEVHGGPVRTGASVIDMSTGFTAYSAIMTALWAREKSGKGQRVMVSLLQTALAVMGSHAAVFLNTGHQPNRAGGGLSHLAPYGAYQTKDGYISAGALSQDAWVRFCRALGREDLPKEPRFADLPDRLAHKQELDAILNASFREKSSAEWIERFEAESVVIAPINTLEQAMTHPQVSANDLIVSTDHPHGDLKFVGLPFSHDGQKTAPQRPPPLLSQHTDEILAELGYAPDSIETLRKDGVI